jgi:hypothetical protein
LLAVLSAKLWLTWLRPTEIGCQSAVRQMRYFYRAASRLTRSNCRPDARLGFTLTVRTSHLAASADKFSKLGWRYGFRVKLLQRADQPGSFV